MADKISVSAGVTKNLGDYNSLRLDAHYETEIKLDETEDEAFARAWTLVEKQVEDKLAEYEED